VKKKFKIKRVIVKPNLIQEYFKYGHMLLAFGDVIVKDGIHYAENCAYVEGGEEKFVTIPLELLWRVADEEDLLEHINS
jgi:hypothetical protein